MEELVCTVTNIHQGDASSPASFEKALSKLSTQITAANLSLETTRSRGRRLKALWTLYTTLTYLVFLLILILVIGPQNWSIPHYAGLAGSPALIYLVRWTLTSVFDWRTGRQQAHVEHLSKQREAKIADLKKATKYDSTQELLQKYGGSPPQKETPSKQNTPTTKQKPRQPTDNMQRTGLPPPPTANIQARQPMQPPSTPPQRPNSRGSTASRQALQQSPVVPDEPGFAPNAYSDPLPPSRPAYEQTVHWYDRILDVMLGEDENLAKNRLALLCHNCRLVNGQAPPGVKTLEDLGKWRCGSCGAWNGVESEGTRAVKEMIEQSKAAEEDGWQPVAKEVEGSDLENDTEIASMNGQENTAKGTGSFQDNNGATKRVTRSSGENPSEGL